MSAIRYSLADAIGEIRLARPETANAVDLVTARAFADAVSTAARDDAVRVLLLTGAGARFCVGGDVRSMAAAADPSGYIHELAVTFDGALRELSHMAKPVVTAVQGAAAGAGLAVVLNADVSIAGRSAQFLTAYTAVGLTPDCGVSYLLPRIIGQQRALLMLLTGRVLSADEALDWGLVGEVVDDENLQARAREVAATLAAGPRFALAESKRLIRSAWLTTREESSRDEAETLSGAVQTEDAAMLMARFSRPSMPDREGPN